MVSITEQTKQIKQDLHSGAGTGDGSLYGAGTGDGSLYGAGYGEGHGDGSGYGYGYGEGGTKSWEGVIYRFLGI